MIKSTELLASSTVPRMGWLSMRIIRRFFPTIATILFCILLPIDFLTNYIGIQISAILETRNVSWQHEFIARIWTGSITGLVFAAILAWVVGLLVEGEAPTFSKTLASLSGPRVVHVIGTVFYSAALVVLPAVVMQLLAYLAPRLLHSILGDALLYIVLPVVAVWTIYFTVMLTFCPFVAVFEGSFYQAAVRRSMFLVKGRVLWVAVRLFAGWLPMIVTVFLAIYIASEVFGIEDDYHFESLSGVAEQIVVSFVGNLALAWFAIYQAILYFRIRKDKHDLTFFDATLKSGFQPVIDLLGNQR